jgi:hypothetical protein
MEHIMASDTTLLVPIGAHVSDTSISSATTLTAESGANRLMIQALDQNVRYTLDNSTPTASHGFRLTADDAPMLIAITNGVSVKVIEETSGAEIQAQWFREVA